MNELKIDNVDIETWRACHRLASELDINNGGNFDERGGGAINLWVTPENKPLDYNFKITQCALNYPANFLATLIRNINGDIILEIENYDKQEQLGDRHKTLEPTQYETEWCIQNWTLLKKFSVFKNYKEFFYCPYCNQEVKAVLYNDFINHLINVHGKKIKAIIFDKGILFEDGSILTTEEYTGLRS